MTAEGPSNDAMQQYNVEASLYRLPTSLEPLDPSSAECVARLTSAFIPLWTARDTSGKASAAASGAGAVARVSGLPAGI